MKTASRRFLVLVFAGTFAAAGVRAGTSDEKDRTLPPRKSNPRNTKIGSSSLSGESSRAAIARSSNRNTGFRAIRFTAAFRTCTWRELSAKTAQFSVDGHALWDFNDYDITVQLADAESRLHKGRLPRVSQLV